MYPAFSIPPQETLLQSPSFPLPSYYRHQIVQLQWEFWGIKNLKQKYNLEFVNQNLLKQKCPF